MAELIREIERNDLPALREILRKVFCDSEYTGIQRLGGMTNHSYRITRRDGRQYVVRIPGEGTEKLINRNDEKKSTELACSLGIDSELLFFGEDGVKVMRFIEDPQCMSETVLQQEENLIQIADIFRKLHSCGVDTGVRFDVFEMASLYEGVIQEAGVQLYPDYHDIRRQIMKVKEAFDADEKNFKVPCHNDSLVANWVLDRNGKLYLIDWEYSGMNDAMWDLSCLSIEANYTREHDERLLQAYYQRDSSVEEKTRFIAAKIFVDYLWSLWGLTRVPYEGPFMQEYADGRYSRLKKTIHEYTL